MLWSDIREIKEWMSQLTQGLVSINLKVEDLLTMVRPCEKQEKKPRKKRKYVKKKGPAS
jgi:hypothetical protein